MQKYIGVKMILALAMTRLAYNEYRGWTMPEDEDGTEEGYLVEYEDNGHPCHPNHKGYISWSPKGVFDDSHRSVEGMSFGFAIEAMRMGEKVARAGWNGKNMWLIMDPGTTVSFIKPGSVYGKAGITGCDINPHIDMMTATGEMQPGWLASQTDMLADDWFIV